ncbi:MAG: NAD(+) diphosphatase [Spirochaetaceae bacterium]|jgi:NAD+ diphosphatase|nr:NAD(+) diphosphatase [Spirochaetaceae bacterium]
MTRQDEGIYLFQGTGLVVSGDIPDASCLRGVAGEQIRASFGEIPLIAIPALDGDRPVMAADLAPGTPLPPAWRLIPARSALSLGAEAVPPGGSAEEPPLGPADGGRVGRFFRAFHITQWRRESAFCGSCGSPNGEAAGELARCCPSCGRIEYPRISPAVIVLIQRDDGRALLAHNRRFVSGVYSLIAGFTEAGESLEAAVAREIREEVGLEVRDTCYVTSQPWPFPNSLMLGFKTRYAAGAIRVDGEEIEDARWFSRDDLPDLPGAGSVSRYLIRRWQEGRL